MKTKKTKVAEKQNAYSTPATIHCKGSLRPKPRLCNCGCGAVLTGRADQKSATPMCRKRIERGTPTSGFIGPRPLVQVTPKELRSIAKDVQAAAKLVKTRPGVRRKGH